jgi:H+/Cl- antiporter ClcA
MPWNYHSDHNYYYKLVHIRQKSESTLEDTMAMVENRNPQFSLLPLTALMFVATSISFGSGQSTGEWFSLKVADINVRCVL